MAMDIQLKQKMGKLFGMRDVIFIGLKHHVITVWGFNKKKAGSESQSEDKAPVKLLVSLLLLNSMTIVFCKQSKETFTA